jgi:hypothetical protein
MGGIRVVLAARGHNNGHTIGLKITSEYHENFMEIVYPQFSS